MSGKTGIWLLVAVLLLPSLSCSRLPGRPDEGLVALQAERLPAPDSIPAAWGKLVSVTTNPAYPGWCQLWFEDDTNTVRMVTFDQRNGVLDSYARVFPRK